MGWRSDWRRVDGQGVVRQVDVGIAIEQDGTGVQGAVSGGGAFIEGEAICIGSTHFGQIMGYSSLVVMTGMVSGPLVAGTLRDLTGTYELGFTILSGLALLGVVFFVLATPPDPPE